MFHNKLSINAQLCKNTWKPVAARGRGQLGHVTQLERPVPRLRPGGRSGPNEEGSHNFCRCLSLNYGALAVPWQLKNYGAATGGSINVIIT